MKNKLIQMILALFDIISKGKIKLDLPVPAGRTLSHIVIHHSLSNDTRTRNWGAIRKYHLSKGWSDIGYHFGIEYENGHPIVVIGRSIRKMGAHVKGFNRESIGVCVVGNFDKVKPPKDKWDMCLELVRNLQTAYDIPAENVLGHHEVQKRQGLSYIKSCPGKKFSMAQFRKDLYSSRYK